MTREVSAWYAFWKYVRDSISVPKDTLLRIAGIEDSASLELLVFMDMECDRLIEAKRAEEMRRARK